MFLNERKIQILEAIINDYIATGEPIGSRTITKKYNFGLSSATIRNEMSDLADMGYITQPHVSAGRSPTDKGYRLYVDRLLKYRELMPDEVVFLETMISDNIARIDYLMEETAKAVSLITNYTTLAVPAKRESVKIGQIQLFPIDSQAVALILVTADKTVKNNVLTVTEAPGYDTLAKLAGLLNAALAGKAYDEIDRRTVEAIANKAVPFGDCGETLSLALETVINLLKREEQINVYLSGTKNILEFPEFNDVKLAKNLLQTFEEKDLLITLLGADGDDSMQIVIGDENNIKELKNCSIIKAGVKASGTNYGTIGIIGPTRMDYSQAAGVLDVIVKGIEKTIKALSGG